MPLGKENINTNGLQWPKSNLKKRKEYNGFQPLIRPEKEEWGISDFEIGKPIGKGGFGSVYLAREKKSKYICAIKVIEKIDSDAIREIKSQRSLRHENIVKLFGVFRHDGKWCLVMEYVPNELYHLREEQKDKRFGDKITAMYLRQICHALLALQQKGLIHRDLKLENLLVTHDNVLKIADFGHATHIGLQKRKTPCGTLDYLCPEMASRSGYDSSADLWCLGIIAYELLFGRTPFYHPDKRETRRKILRDPVKFPEEYHDKHGKDFIKKLLNKKREDRMTVSQALKHPYLTRKYI